MKYRQAKKNIKKDLVRVIKVLEGNPLNAVAYQRYVHLLADLRLLKLYKDIK